MTADILVLSLCVIFEAIERLVSVRLQRSQLCATNHPVRPTKYLGTCGTYLCIYLTLESA